MSKYPVVDLIDDGKHGEAVDPDAQPNPNRPVEAFSPEGAPGLSLMMQFRIYDVLMALLEAANPTLAANVYRAHSEGHSIGFSPSFSGTFIADAIREESFGMQEVSDDVEPISTGVDTTPPEGPNPEGDFTGDPITDDEAPLPHDSVSDKSL